MLRHLGLVCFALAAVLACSSEDAATVATTDAATDSADAATTCVLRDGACSPGCCAQSGMRYDSTRDCIDSTSWVIGCAPKPASTGCGYLGVIGCAITLDGTFQTTDHLAGWEPPTKCSESVAGKVSGAKSCVTPDAGSD